jgi:hypothetical protein
MKLNPYLKAAGALVVLSLVIGAAMLNGTRVAKAVNDDDNDRNESKVKKGFQIAPVPLNLAGKNPELVGLGSYIDHLHPNCVTGQTDCLPAPFKGDLLQIMPWPNFQYMTEHDLRAIYEYLSAIPCIEGPADPTNPLHNDCP